MRLGPVILVAGQMVRVGAAKAADEGTPPPPRKVRLPVTSKRKPKHLVAGMTPEERNALKAWRRKQRSA